MAVLVEAISVIVKVSKIYEYCGWLPFREIVPNNTLCCDNEIARVGFMSPNDVEQFIDELTSFGFVFCEDDQAQDIAVAEQLKGITTKCSWLECGLLDYQDNPDQRISACQLVGGVENQIFTPEGWTFEDSLSNECHFRPTEKADSNMGFVRDDDGMEVYLNKLTGKEVYVGRTRDA